MRVRVLVLALILSLILGVAGCAVSPVFESEQEAVILDQLAAGAEVSTPADHLLAIPAAMQRDLDQAIHPDWSQMRKFRALRRFLFDENERNVEYQANATLTAAETFDKRHGNCLAISNLFVASARYLGLDARYQTVWVRPTWESSNQTMIRYEHIVAIGKLNTGDEYVVDFLPEFSVSERGKQVITDEKALALYHNNLGAEAVVGRDLDRAVTELLKAARLWPENSDVWNNLGAAWRRLGENQLAEMSYKRALRLEKNNYSALANLTQFYLGSGRREDAESFIRRVKRYYERNPYYYYYMAQLNAREGELDRAIESLNNAVRLKKDDADFYHALSDVHGRLGHEAMAARYASMAEAAQPRPARSGRERTGSVRTFRISRFN